MADHESQSFDAFLPRVEQPVRIACLHDGQVFARRWVIRDKDPSLKAIVRRLNKARSSEAATGALRALQAALASRNLLRPGSG